MSSSQDGKMNSDAEMVKAPLAPVDESAPEPTCVAGFLSFREMMARRKAEKEIIQTTEEKSSSPEATDAPASGSEVPILPEVGERSEMQSLEVPSQAPGSLSVPIIVEDKEEAVEPVPPAKREIVLGLRAASAVPVSRSRKRKCVAPVDGGPPLPEGLCIAPVLRGKFISLIDGMIGDCSTEAARLARELGDAQGQLSEIQSIMTALKDSCTAKVSRLEGQVGELERDLGKTASALIKEKKTRKAKASEVRRLQHQIETSEGLMRRSADDAMSALRAGFQSRLAGFAEILGSLELVYRRDLISASIDGGMAIIHALKDDPSSSLQSEEDSLSARRFELGSSDRTFELLLSDLRSECVPERSAEDAENPGSATGEDGDEAAASEAGEGDVQV
ncbi:Uncharacterized protein Rs2_15835 [Raphanus sativus]|nr:Uncharacterized protein Rs2_15835 [Raphanus sativus]